jgi:NitT/TauT family transport system ATP-binding protein
VASVAAELAREPLAGGGAAIAIANVDVTYGVGGPEPVKALSGVTLDIPDGAFVSLVGPSGCGKSTLLKVVADLMAPTRGAVTVGGTPPRNVRHAGRIGLVFQQANLMPWLKVAANVGLLRDLVARRGGAPREAGTSIDELIRVVGLAGFETKYPHQLSGGMQQRVALTRALALDPAVLLMDEPFAALDEITRDRMAFELMRLWHRYRKTVLFVHTASPKRCFCPTGWC